MFTKLDYFAKALCFALLLLLSNVLFAQKTISGTVTNNNNQPVAGATVIVKGTTVATQTDDAGNFTISLPSGRSVLTFSSVGFETQ